MVFALILLTVPFGRVVAHSLYRLLPETVEHEAQVPADIVDLAEVPTGTLLRRSDGRLAFLTPDDAVLDLALPAPCQQLAHRQRTIAACALGTTGIALLDASAEGAPGVRTVPVDGDVTAVMVIGTRLVAGTRDGRIVLFEAGESVERLGELDLGDEPVTAVMTPPGLVAVGIGSNLVLVDAAHPDGMTPITSLPLGGPAVKVDYVGSAIYAAGGSELTVVDVARPDAPHTLARLDAGGPITGFNLANSTVGWVVADGVPTRAVRNSLNGQVWWGLAWGPAADTIACGGGFSRLTCLTPDRRLLRYDIYPSKDEVVLVVGAVVGGLIVLWIGLLLWRRPEGFVGRLVWSAVGIGAVVWLLSGSYKVPIEALHILEYTTLGALGFRALALGGRAGLSTAIVGVLTGFTAGMLDESIQWAHPMRTGAIEDVLLDTQAATVGVLLAWQALRIGRGGSPMPWSVVPAHAAVLVLWVAAFQHGTVGFGEVHQEGPYTFTSRLSRAELDALDAADTDARRQLITRGAHLPYGDFLGLVEGEDWYVYELAVHAYRRDRRLAQGDLAVACAEHRLTERIYGRSLDGTPMRWGPGQRALCAEEPEVAYVSPVSADLIAWARPWQWWTVASVLAGGLLAAAIALFLRERRP